MSHPKHLLASWLLLSFLLFISFTPSLDNRGSGASSLNNLGVVACEVGEREALLDLQTRTRAASHGKWPYSWKGSDCCAWPGVTCDAHASASVTSLRITTGYAWLNQDPSCGPLPSSLAALHSLRVLDVAGTCFSDPLPPSLGSLKNLTRLNLSGTAFAALHTEILGSLKKLTHLDFSNNFLSYSDASITGIELLQSLVYFRFSNNEYNAGPFPANVTSLQRLVHLNLSSNNIQDVLPQELGHMTSLKYLDLHGNALSGSIPPQLGFLQSLVYLDLSSNSLQGPVPLQSLGNLSHLRHFDVSGAGNVWLNAAARNSNRQQQCKWSAHLEYLGLSFVQLPSHTTPFCFDSLIHSNLTFLDLSYSGLNTTWEVTYKAALSKAPNLLYLAIAGTTGDFPPWLNRFIHLQSLDISHCSLTGSIPKWLGELRSLRALDASGNTLTGEIPADVIANLSSLQFLKLPQNSLTGEIPTTIGNLSSLQWLDLSSNHLTGSIPSTLGLLQLELNGVLLSSNDLSGTLPFAIGNIAKLDASNNHLSGPLPSFIGNWSRIRYCELYGNNISGSIPHSIGNWTQLWHLSMGQNQLGGCIPDSVGQLTQLSIVPQKDMTGDPVQDFYDYAEAYGLYLSHNYLACSIPKTIGSLQNLIYLDVSNNNLTGTLPSLLNLTALLGLIASHNALSGKVSGPLTVYNNLDLSANAFEGPIPYILVPSHQTGSHHVGLADEADVVIDLSQNKFTGPIHEQICSNLTSRFISISLSSNLLMGTIPTCLSRLSGLSGLDVSNNALSGSLPALSSDALGFLDVSKNLLSGSLPSSMANLSALVVLDMSNNFLSGSLASSITSSTGQILQVLKLGNNSFDKQEVPESIGSFPDLVTLSLHSNRFTGAIPSSLRNCSGLDLLDLSHNRLTGGIPDWISNATFPGLRVLSLRNNRLDGHIPDALVKWPFLYILDLANNDLSGVIPANLDLLSGMKEIVVDHLKGLKIDRSSDTTSYNDITISFKNGLVQLYKVVSIYTILDLSGNQLHGGIPPQIGALRSLFTLNLSHNMLSGTIPSSLQDLSELESLDLSYNLLVGPIPRKLLSLSFLEVLDLSHNRLQGPIPPGSQLNTFSASSFEDNPELCGVPLPNACPASDPPHGATPPMVYRQTPSRITVMWHRFKESVSIEAIELGCALGFIVMAILWNFVIWK